MEMPTYSGVWVSRITRSAEYFHLPELLLSLVLDDLREFVCPYSSANVSRDRETYYDKDCSRDHASNAGLCIQVGLM